MDENDLFALAVKAMEADSSAGEFEKTWIVIGEKGSGKTSLIASLVGEEVKSEKQSTAGIDFKYSAKKVETRKVVGNFYEIGGGRLLSDLLGTVLTGTKMKDTVVIIAIDMSQPDTALYHLDFWLKKLRQTVDHELERLDNGKISPNIILLKYFHLSYYPFLN